MPSTHAWASVRRLQRLAWWLLVLALACRDPDGGPRYRGAGAAQPRSGGTLTFSAPANLATLDPAIAYDEISAFCLHHVYDTLVGYPAVGTPAAQLGLVPRLASSWTISPDGRVYRFQLRPGVTFSDGTPLSASDFAYAWRRVLRTPESPFPAFLAPIEGAAAYAAGTRDDVPGLRAEPGVLELRLIRPDAAFLFVLAMPFSTPVREAIVTANAGDLRRAVVGTGAFVVAEWREGEQLVLARNPHHWDAPRPYLDRLVFRENLPRGSAFLGFTRGELDVVDRLSGPDWLAISGRPGWRPYVHVVPQLSTFGARLDVRRPPFDDVRVRRALNYAVDKSAQVRALHGLAVPAHGLLPPAMLGRDEALAPYPHDPARARTLLAEAGYPDGLDLEYVTVKEEYAERLAQLLQADLAAVGVRVRISVLSFATYLEATAAVDGPPFSYTSWLMDYPDPSNFLDVRFHSKFVGASNDSGYANPELDRVLDEARTLDDPVARAVRYRRAERILHDDAPWIWGYHPQIAVVVQPYVRDAVPHPVWVHDYTAAWLDLGPAGQRLRR